MRFRAVLVAGMSVAVAALGAGAATAAPPAPPAVTCGSILEQDAYLTQDLRCPEGNGIFLEIDVTLDLRGHRLIGPGATATPTGPGRGIGVHLSPAWPSGVVGGTITGWPIGIGGNEDFETSETFSLSRLTLSGNGTAVQANQARMTADRLTVRGNSVGIDALSRGEVGTQLTVSASTFRDNGTAVRVDARTTVDLRGSTFERNGTGYTATAGTPDGYAALLEGNTFSRNGDGIRAEVPGTSLRQNTATRNTGWGIYAPGAVDLGGNVARRNGRSPQCVGVVCSS